MKHVCGQDPESCFCMYDPELNSELKVRRLIPADAVIAWLWSRGPGMGNEVDLFCEHFDVTPAMRQTEGPER